MFPVVCAIIAALPVALGITILPRAAWGEEYIPNPPLHDLAVNPPAPSKNPNWTAEAGVFIHYRGSLVSPSDYSNEEECKQDIAKVFEDHALGGEFNGDIAYNFLVCPHGNIYQGRGYERGEANHEGYVNGYGRNTAFYSICGLLNPGQIPSEAMVRAIRDLIEHLRTEAPKRTGSLILPHSFEYDTDCPGYLQMYSFSGSTMDPSVPWSGLGDIKVYDAQRSCNARYANNAVGYVSCTEDGRTGWTTVYSLTQGLQWELGISPTVRNFGSGTFSAIQSRNKMPSQETSSGILRQYNAALWCKGYPGSRSDGLWDSQGEDSWLKLYSDAGLGDLTDRTKVWPHVCRAMFRMDQFRQIPQGSATTRQIQQWLNKRFVADVGIPAMILVPCDGWYSRDVAAGFMMGLQYELGIAVGSINGNFGPATQAALRGIGSQALTGNLRYLFRSACYFNSPTHSPGGDVFYSASDLTTDAATDSHVEWLIAFQKFSQIPVTGTNDYTTWAQLLVSMGDADRPATGCDCITEITSARGAALKAAGYQIVGRYLDENVPPTDPHYLGKALKPNEPQTILDAGLRFFPIFQYGGRDASSFTYDSGSSHGAIAHDKAAGFRIPAGTCIYFAVDYDALDEDVDSSIIPYFRGVRDALQSKGSRYKYCVYGSRNICSRISKEVGATWSFVSGMSWGYSGNMGFPLPENWSLNQIKEFTFTGAGGFGLDNDVWRTGSDPGVSHLD
jgi:peptidoglycan hydrolase-like protein with peptidoglycan-binding domain